MPPVPELPQGRGLGWGLPLPFAGAGVPQILFFFRFAAEVVRAATRPLAAPVSSRRAVSKRRGFPAQRPRGRVQKWAEKEAELKINVSKCILTR